MVFFSGKGERELGYTGHLAREGLRDASAWFTGVRNAA